MRCRGRPHPPRHLPRLPDPLPARTDARVRVGFEVDSVERDGRAEPWSRERIDNGVRVRIGDADVDCPQGEHTYVIRYRTTRQLGFFDDL